ncbi:MAG: hypothetical protein GXY83_32715 [Rhodopirellula sp.]|nr:hypothetical protein [Rhodopirellula sp.]
MDCFAAAVDSAKVALEKGCIGTPVAVQIMVNTAEGGEDLDPLLGRGLEASAFWLGDEPQRLAALGGAENGQISVLAKFPKGQTALVCAGAEKILATPARNMAGSAWRQVSQ